MGIMTCIPSGATPGARVATLAEEAAMGLYRFIAGTLTGPDLLLFQNLSAPQCWDAALYCAWAAKGVECAAVKVTGNPNAFGVTDAHNYSRIFGPNPTTNGNRVAANVAQMRSMPEGCFVGFIGHGGELRHAMLHTRNGMGAGNKSGCVLSEANGSGFGWEALDMTRFFTHDQAMNGNSTTTVVYMPCTGQVI